MADDDVSKPSGQCTAYVLRSAGCNLSRAPLFTSFTVKLPAHTLRRARGNTTWIFLKMGFLFVGVLVIRAPLFGVQYIRVPRFLKTPT